MRTPACDHPSPAGSAWLAGLYLLLCWQVPAQPGAWAINTIAGGGIQVGVPTTDALLGEPQRVAVDDSGNVYVADSGNNRVRRIDAATGTIDTVAGSGEHGYRGDGGDGGPATDALLARPQGVAVDDSGNVYVADTWNHRVRKLTPSPDDRIGRGGWGRRRWRRMPRWRSTSSSPSTTATGTRWPTSSSPPTRRSPRLQSRARY